MGIEALYRKPNTSRRNGKDAIYPYLLRTLSVERPIQVWAMDITYIPMAKGFVYQAAVIDWYSRCGWRDNVFVERLWKSVTYEEVYLHAYDSVSHAKTSHGRYFAFYNTRRPHSSLDRKTPDQVYFNLSLPMPKAA